MMNIFIIFAPFHKTADYQMFRQIAILSIILCLSMAAKAQDDAEDDEDCYSNPVVDSLVREYAAATSDTARVRLCIEIGSESDHPDTVLKYSYIGISLCNGKDTSVLASCYGYLGWAYNCNKQFDKAADYYKKAIEMCDAIGKTNGVVLNSANLSHIYRNIRAYNAMWQTLYDALSGAQRNADTANMCYCYYLIADYYNELGMKQLGIEAARKIFQLAEQARHYDDMALGATTMTALLEDETDSIACREAIRWAHIALDCYEKADDDLPDFYIGMQSDTYVRLMEEYLYLANLTGNDAYIDSASYFLEVNDDFIKDFAVIDYEVLSRQNWASVKYARHDYKGSARMLLDVLKMTADNELDVYNTDIWRDLAKTYEKLGDYRNALRYYAMYREEQLPTTNANAVMEAAAFEVKSQVEQEQELAEAEQRMAEAELADKHRHFVRMMIVSAAGFVALLVFVFFVWRMLQDTRKGNAALLSHNEEIRTQNDEFAAEKANLELINNKIRQSMRYARRIQMATVSSEEEIDEVFPNALVYNSPCEIVSGDWYWTARIGSKRLIALGGSARVGVPGALVSMMTVNALKDTVGQLSAMSKVSPSAILRTVQSKLPEVARNNAAGLSLCVFGRGNVRFAGVNQNAVLLQNSGSVIMHGDEPGDMLMTVAEGDTVVLYSASTKRELLDRDIRPEEFCNMLAQQSPDARKGIIEELMVQKEQREDITVVSITI